MCNIAGYVGTENATPILLKMIKAQEGLNGGFYSGFAVHDGENLRYCKLRGDFAKLEGTYPVDSFVGTTGIIHSRTPSGGGDLWAHPFAAPNDRDIRLCYVANGGYGKYKDQKESYNAIADALVAEGYDIPCKVPEQSSKYNCLSTGESVHMSDIVCQMIYKYKTQGMNASDAMACALTRMPHEVVGLVIEKESADRIYFARINMPMFVAFDDTGAYLASSPTAFPAHIREFKLLPALSSGVIFRYHFEAKPFPAFADKVRGFNRKTLEKATHVILNLLREGEKDFADMRQAVLAFLPGNTLVQAPPIVYIVLYELLRSGRITMRQTTKAVAGQIAPATRFRLT